MAASALTLASLYLPLAIATMALAIGIKEAVKQFFSAEASPFPSVVPTGDVARWNDPRFGGPLRVEHWVVAQRMGAAAARSILGRPGGFRDVPFFWSAHYDVFIAYVGHAERWDRIDVHGSLEAKDTTLACRERGKTLAVVTIGRDRTSLEAELAYERGDEAALDSFGKTR